MCEWLSKNRKGKIISLTIFLISSLHNKQFNYIFTLYSGFTLADYTREQCFTFSDGAQLHDFIRLGCSSLTMVIIIFVYALFYDVPNDENKVFGIDPFTKFVIPLRYTVAGMWAVNFASHAIHVRHLRIEEMEQDLVEVELQPITKCVLRMWDVINSYLVRILSTKKREIKISLLYRM